MAHAVFLFIGGIMPKINVKGAEIYYEESGSGDETIIFSHGLLWSGRMFDQQVAYFKEHYRVITYDHRGQGQSEVTKDGYDMDTLYEDAAALIQALNAAPCHFVGLSMGGFVAMRLAARRPELLKSLILMETSADPEPPENVSKYKMLNLVARWLSLRLVAGQVMPIMFGQKFLNDPARIIERKLWRERMIANDRIGITRAVMGVVNRNPIYDELTQITLPTLILVGDQDVATVPAKSERIHQQIDGSNLVIIAGAGHTSSVEEPKAVNEAVDAFLRAM